MIFYDFFFGVKEACWNKFKLTAIYTLEKEHAYIRNNFMLECICSYSRKLRGDS